MVLTKFFKEALFINICFFDTKKKYYSMPTNEERYESNRSKIQSNYEDHFTWSFNKSARHAGTFRSDNPYLQNLKQASSKQDEDALYELAVKSEAELAQYERERADRRADLEEQRAYDDPFAVVARQRRAGINPDLVGSSAGAGSSAGTGSSAVASMPSLETPTDNTTPFANGSLMLQGFQVASSLIGSIASFGSSVVDAVDTISMLPHKFKGAELLNEAQDISNESSALSLIGSKVDGWTQLSKLITPETTDEDGLSLLSSLGVSDPTNELKVLRHIQQHPEYIADWEEDKKRKIANQEWNEVYTEEVVNRSISLSEQLTRVDQSLQLSQKDFQYKVSSLLNTDENASYVAETEKIRMSNDRETANYDSDRLNLMHQKLERDLSAFGAQLDMVNEGIKQSEDLIKKIKNSGKPFMDFKTGRCRNIGNLYYTPEEYATIQIEQQKIKAYRAMGSQYMNSAYSYLLNTISRDYFDERMMQSDGELRNFATHPDIVQFLQNAFTFEQFVSGQVSSNDIVSQLAGMGIDLVKLIFGGAVTKGTSALSNLAR